MRSYRKIFIVIWLAALLAACSSTPRFRTPLETLQLYAGAFKKKDYTTMKNLMSEATLKMHQQSAQAQGIPLDDIIERETLFVPDQKTAEFRNQKIDGDKATLEMKDASGLWNTVNFVLEEGVWKLDKQGFANQMIEQNDQDNKKLDELINQGKQP